MVFPVYAFSGMVLLIYTILSGSKIMLSTCLKKTIEFYIAYHLISTDFHNFINKEYHCGPLKAISNQVSTNFIFSFRKLSQIF